MPEQDPLQQPAAAPAVSTRVAPRNNLGIPIAIVLSALLIAGAIIYTGSNRKSTVNVNGNDTVTQETPEIQIAPVTKDDMILGNPNAPILIVEYSDYDCPFCRIFHDTMTKVMEEYGKDGKVAWVFRHFPLEQLHPNAIKIHEASYCVAELGGNDAFWEFTNALNDSRKIELAPDGNIKSVDPTNMSRITEFALAGGVDKAKFEACYNSGKYTSVVREDIQEAIKTGARGTPHSFIMVGGQQTVINGAQPYANVKQLIDNVLAQTGA